MHLNKEQSTLPTVPPVGVSVYRFGPFALDCVRRQLLEGQEPVRIGSRALDILRALLDRAGEVVSRRELIDRVWPDTVVVDANLTVHIGALRQALGDGQAGRRFIVNVQGRGYSFVAPVRADEQSGPSGSLSVVAVAHNLPMQLTRLVGRQTVVGDLAEAVSKQRLTSLVGPAGIGKTQLAFNIGRQALSSFEHGVWVVELAGVTDPMLVGSALASVLKLGVRSENPLPGLIAALQERRTLIILDNCEHLVDSVAAIATALLKATTQVHLLVTSRESLRVQGEQLKRVTPLDLPPADVVLCAADAMRFPSVQLFVERAGAAVPGFELNDADAVAACAICRRLDGMPLAIEFAAARVEALGVRGLASRLDDRLRLLTGGRRGALPRHRTLSAALEWSFKLLGEQEQAGLRRLAAFAGSFTLEAALSVAGLIAEAVVELVEKSLVVVEVGDKDARFRLLQTTRAFALDRLEEAGEGDQVGRRHAEYWRDELVLHGEAAGEQLRELFAMDVDNIRTALHWAFSASGEDALAIGLASGSASLWIELSLLAEAGRWARRAIAFIRPGQHLSSETLLHCSLGLSLLYTEGVSEEATAALQRARELSNGTGDVDWQLQVLVALAWISYRKEDYEESLALAREARRLTDGSHDPIGLFTADWLTAAAHFFRGEYQEALPAARKACSRRLPAVRRAHIASWEIEHAVSAKCSLVNTLWVRGQLEQARDVADGLIQHALGEGHAVSLCMSLTWAGCPIPLRLGELDVAERTIARLKHLAKSNGLANMCAAGQCFEGLLRAQTGSVEDAAELIQAGLVDLRRGGSMTHYTQFVGELSLVLLSAGRLGAALERADEAVQRAERHGTGWWMPEAYRAKGEVLASMQREEMALQLFERALTMAQRQNAASWVLRIKQSVARLHHERGRTDLARAVLAEGLAGISEGSRYAEPTTARRLLEEWS